MFSVRKFRDADARAVGDIMAEVWGHDPEMRHVYEYHKDWQNPPTSLIRQTLVAESQDRVIGVGTIFESIYSPYVLFLSIHVAPVCQRMGVGTLLYNELIALGDARPHTVKMTRKDAAGMSFLEKRGFYAAVNTLRGVIDPSSERVKVWVKMLPSEAQDVVTLNVDDAGEQARPTPFELAMAHFRVYQQYHKWSPPAIPGEERAVAWFLGEAVPGTNYCVYYRDELVGAANLIATPFDPANGAEGYLVWVGVLESAEYDVVQVTAVLIRRLLEKAGELGLKVRFEADSTYVPHRQILENAPTVERDNDFLAMMDGRVA